MIVEDILKNKGASVVTVTAGSTLEEVAKRLTYHGIGAIVVVADEDSDRMVGIISERDIVRLAAGQGAAALSMRANAAMTERVVTCSREDTIDEVISLLSREKIRHVPVFEHEKLVGMLSIRDIIENRLDEQAMEIGMWRELFTPR